MYLNGVHSGDKNHDLFTYNKLNTRWREQFYKTGKCWETRNQPVVSRVGREMNILQYYYLLINYYESNALSYIKKKL